MRLSQKDALRRIRAELVFENGTIRSRQLNELERRIAMLACAVGMDEVELGAYLVDYGDDVGEPLPLWVQERIGG